MAVLGPLLGEVLTRIEAPERELGFLAVASVGMTVEASETTLAAEELPAEEVPVTALLPRLPPDRDEPWDVYRDKTLQRLQMSGKGLESMGLEPEPLVTATAFRFRAAPDHLRHLEAHGWDIEVLELDPLLEATALDEVPADIDLPSFREKHPDLDGASVTVAVLDTGVDPKHPYLDVAESFTVCDEPVEVPGQHGTHCAGIIASRDDEFRGVAPGVRLVNIKVGRANNRVEPGAVALGLDRASALGARIVSVSLGFNHRPRYAIGGHGWSCSRGRPCLVCRSVDHVGRRGQQLMIIAAGNEHEKAEAMRRAGDGAQLDTELCCPGQARRALTVGSINKRSWLPAHSSSRGPSSSGASKPDIAAPGVNVASTIPVPRGSDGSPVTSTSRGAIFARDSGTSMATPVVAGVAALLAQRMERAGREATPAALRRALMRAAQPLPFGREAVGTGRTSLP